MESSHHLVEMEYTFSKINWNLWMLRMLKNGKTKIFGILLISPWIQKHGWLIAHNKEPLSVLTNDTVSSTDLIHHYLLKVAMGGLGFNIIWSSGWFKWLYGTLMLRWKRQWIFDCGERKVYIGDYCFNDQLWFASK